MTIFARQDVSYMYLMLKYTLRLMIWICLKRESHYPGWENKTLELSSVESKSVIIWEKGLIFKRGFYIDVNRQVKK